MNEDVARIADRILEEALDASGSRDPREFYRERLRDLKEADSDAYARAVDYYRTTLIPTVAEGRAEPLDAWTEYGRVLAEAVAPGRTVCIDETGLAVPYTAPRRDRLIIHLPEGKRGRALLVGLPAELSPAQRATYDVLVAGKQRPAE